MEILLPHTDTALSDCLEHVSACEKSLGDGVNPAIKAYLARHVAVLMCAEIESVVTKLIHERVDLCGDPPVANLVKSVRGNLVRNAKFDEIGNKLALLGKEFRERFNQAVSDSIGVDGIAIIGMAVGKRDASAHSDPPNVTLPELKRAYVAATGLVAAVREALTSTDEGS